MEADWLVGDATWSGRRSVAGLVWMDGEGMIGEDACQVVQGQVE